MNKLVYCAREASRLSGVPEADIRRMMDEGQLPFHFRGRTKTKRCFLYSDLEQALKELTAAGGYGNGETDK